ncbi:hypothetical protein PE067_14050 [Paracoccus sp. DMF-8]|nr:hypothetical protein [Paracoccus sp. DMF-8]MDF3607158.1 hypothetical protein [Paracoccus sp. DMF-8]
MDNAGDVVEPFIAGIGCGAPARLSPDANVGVSVVGDISVNCRISGNDA